MTPDEFIKRWKGNSLTERAGAQAHFDDLCDLLGVEKPRKEGAYQYEYGAKKSTGGDGFADVWKRGYFGWENKKPGRDLKAALKQLTDYSLALENPPLLVVCDRERIEIHTAFTGYPDEVTNILLAEIGLPENLQILKYVFTDPQKLRPKKSTYAITEEAAGEFAQIADSMRTRGIEAQRVAHFLMQCVFCMFAEDEGLLPLNIFSNLLAKAGTDPKRAIDRLAVLFKAMQKGGDYGDDTIAYFNGGLFKNIDIPALEKPELDALAAAAINMDWRAIEPAILGTLFERGLNPKKRSQLGAHYTDAQTIMRIIDPVIKQPLLEQWEETRLAIAKTLQKSKKQNDKAHKESQKLFQTFLEKLRNFRVLDPACGSGNFLYLALKTLKDIEKQVNLDAERLGLQRQVGIEVSPANVLGIELDPYAAELARVTVWIGELQWMLQNGYEYNRNPILNPLDNIENRDALIDADGIEAQWPVADVIVGNPPFLGGKKMLAELGEDYLQILRKAYKAKVPSGADLVCYWFEKSGRQMALSNLKIVGLVSTNSIRGGSNRTVLDHICEDGKIFNAWSDEEWINEGAAVRVSIICFKDKLTHTNSIMLDGKIVSTIFADLTADSEISHSVDLTKANKLIENSGMAFIGTQKSGAFDISGVLARSWLSLPNPHNQSNSMVIRPWINGLDIVRRPQDMWIVDFGVDITNESAMLFDAPYAHIFENVYKELNEKLVKWHAEAKPTKHLDSQLKTWWLLWCTRPELREAILPLHRYIATARVAKYRLFTWVDHKVLPDSQVVAMTRADDTTFGILHSRFHELWSLRMCTWMGKGNDPRYTPTTCFETYPFPQGLTPADTLGKVEITEEGYWLPPVDNSVMGKAKAIASAAFKLNALRNNWLNPTEWVDWVRTAEEELAGFPLRPVAKPEKEAELKKRTLTNLYNLQPAWLLNSHKALDKAVADAYGWNDYTPEMSDDEILARLLKLNLER